MEDRAQGKRVRVPAGRNVNGEEHMWQQIAGKLPFLAAPLALGGAFVVLFAALPKPTDATRGAGRPDAGGVSAGFKEIPIAKNRNILTVFDYLNETVVEKTLNHIFPAKAAVETTARVLNKNSSICDDPFLEAYVTDILNQYGQIDNFYVANPKGSRIMASRMGSNIETDVIDRSGDEPVYLKKRGGRVISRKTEKELVAAHGEEAIYDPRTRPWYKKAEAERKISWSDVYIFATGSGDRQPGFTVSCPTIGADGELLFVTAADFVVSNFSGFLRELKVGVNGIAFLMNEKEELIGYPDSAKVVKIQGAAAVLAKAEEILPDWARPALGIRKAKGERVFFFDQASKRYIAYFGSFLPSSGNNWEIVVIVPEEDFFNLSAKEKG